MNKNGFNIKLNVDEVINKKNVSDLDMISSKSSFIMHLCNRTISNIRSISYVSRVREIQKIKEDKGYCDQIFGNTGNYLLYVKVRTIFIYFICITNTKISLFLLIEVWKSHQRNGKRFIQFCKGLTNSKHTC